MNVVLAADGVSKSYGGRAALRELNVDFPEGRAAGLLGPNGAGKSTLLKMAVGLTRPDRGSIRVFGDDSPSWCANASIAYLPDRAKWYARHTVARAVDYCAGVYPGFSRGKARELLAEMKLDEAAFSGELSRGQQACLMLALCLARQARLVLLDEPFSGIDLVCRERIIRGIIDSISDQSRTIVISTQEIYEAESLFEYVAFIKDGSLLESGDAEEMRSRYGSIESNYRRLFQ